jgi:SRSO17 transposase
MRSIPHDTLITGRIRSDAKLYYLPHSQPEGAGRRRIYGQLAPTPEQLRREESIPWRRVRAFAVGRYHEFRVKRLRPLRWRATSDQSEVQLLVIAPLGYRLCKNSKVLYRQPAYLICTDATLPIQQLLQQYLWRWDIEVNFRDEKTLLGVGQAQVRHPASTQSVPALAVAAYALLLLAARKTFPSERMPLSMPLPKWRSRKRSRASTQNLIALLRQELWADAITSRNFSHFRSTLSPNLKSRKLLPNLKDALFYAPN